MGLSPDLGRGEVFAGSGPCVVQDQAPGRGRGQAYIDTGVKPRMIYITNTPNIFVYLVATKKKRLHKYIQQ